MNPIVLKPMTLLIVAAVLCTFGMLLHFLKKMADVEATGTVLSPAAYFRQAPYRTLLAILSSYMLLAVYYWMGMLNPLVALFSGIACSSAYDSLRARAIRRLQQDDGLQEDKAP